MKIIILCSFVLLFVPLETVHGGEDVPNLKIVQRLMETSLDSLVLPKPVHRFSFGPSMGQGRGYLQNTLAQYFNRGADGDSSVAGTAEFHVEQFAIDIVYLSDFSLLPWQADSLQRIIRFSYSGWYMRGGKGPVVPFSIIRRSNDRISDAQREKLEASPYLFSHGTLQKRSIWSRVAEPVLVISAVATMVYLFFTVRS